MSGRNVNVYLQEKTYSKLRQVTNERQISRFVNEAIEEKLTRKKAEAEKELEQAYQEIAQDQARWKLTKQWEKASLKDLRKRLK